MKRNSSKFQLLYVNRKKTKSERYRVRDTQTWSKSITLKILSLSLGILSTPERWPDFSSFSNIALERHNRPRNEVPKLRLSNKHKHIDIVQAVDSFSSFYKLSTGLTAVIIYQY